MKYWVVMTLITGMLFNAMTIVDYWHSSPLPRHPLFTYTIWNISFNSIQYYPLPLTSPLTAILVIGQSNAVRKKPYPMLGLWNYFSDTFSIPVGQRQGPSFVLVYRYLLTERLLVSDVSGPPNKFTCRHLHLPQHLFLQMQSHTAIQLLSCITASAVKTAYF